MELAEELRACLQELTACGTVEIRENGGASPRQDRFLGKCGAHRRSAAAPVVGDLQCDAGAAGHHGPIGRARFCWRWSVSAAQSRSGWRLFG